MLVLSLALAGTPPGVVLVSPEAPGAQETYAQEGGQGTLACSALVEEVLQLCYRLEADGVRRYVTTADLAAWDMDLHELRVHAADALTENPLKRIDIDGGGHYFQSAAPTGREATVLLHPEWLGEGRVVGVPSRGVVVVWTPGDEQLDKMVSVGVTQMHSQLPHPITPVVIQPSEEGWKKWGEAKQR